jgi:hypothetical protein
MRFPLPSYRYSGHDGGGDGGAGFATALAAPLFSRRVLREWHEWHRHWPFSMAYRSPP